MVADGKSEMPGPRTQAEESRRAGVRRVPLILAVAAVCLVYLGAASRDGKSFRSTDGPHGFHALIANALVHGRLDVLATPPGLLALADPYDPAANAAFRAGGYHDLALHEGRLYTATGPTTAVFLYLPARLLGLGNLNPNLGTFLCGVGGFLASITLFAECRRRFFPRFPVWADLTVVVGLGLGSPVLWLVSIGRAYENTIACGYLLTSTGLYLLLRALRDQTRPVRWQLALGSFALAAAVGARPHLAMAFIFVVAAAVAVVWAHGRDRSAARVPLACLFVPYLAAGMLLAMFNYARFGSIFEFGTTYQLAGMNMPAYRLYRANYIGPNLVDYLVLPPRLERSWPFVHLSKSTFVDDPSRHGHEPVAGVLLLYPSIVVGVLTITARARSILVEQRGFACLLFLGAAFGSAGLLAVSLPFNASTMRYTVDFAPALALVASLGWGWAFERSQARTLLTAIWIGSVAAGALTGVALVLTPCRGTGSC